MLSFCCANLLNKCGSPIPVEKSGHEWYSPEIMKKCYSTLKHGKSSKKARFSINSHFGDGRCAIRSHKIRHKWDDESQQMKGSHSNVEDKHLCYFFSQPKFSLQLGYLATNELCPRESLYRPIVIKRLKKVCDESPTSHADAGTIRCN